MKISIITPSFNSFETLKRAIESVLAQDHTDYEHIIVDGGSKDGTVELLRSYDHLKWISEPDGGQVDAMRKGFAMSTGELIGNLNADDYYLPGAFCNVLAHFDDDTDFVVGRVRVHTEHTGRTWINDPEIDLRKMLKHWLPNAFCVNPVGYFYRRYVQDEIPFNLENDDKHDLEFLLEAGLRFRFRKIDSLLGVFEHVMEAKTFQQQMQPSYWNAYNFPFVDKLLAKMDSEYQCRFRQEQERGYQVRRHWTAQEANTMGLTADLLASHELFPLPQDDKSALQSRCGFSDFDKIGTPGDWIITILSTEDVGSDLVYRAITDISPGEMDACIYYLHHINDEELRLSLSTSSCYEDRKHLARGLVVGQTFREHKYNMKWKFIAGVRDPVAVAFASFSRIEDVTRTERESRVRKVMKCLSRYFESEYRRTLGIDIYAEPFPYDDGFRIAQAGTVEVLIYRFEDLPKIFGGAMDSFIGVSKMTLPESEVFGESQAQKGKGGDAREPYKIDPNLLDEVFTSKYVQYFYSGQDIERLRRKWSG